MNRHATPVEIQKELVLSTAHIPKWIAQALDSIDSDLPCEGKKDLEHISFDKVQYGYLVFVFENDEGDPLKPWELRGPFKLARVHGCRWIRFDCDGPRVEGLRSWVW